ncbi:cadmium-translocating P-type ATPase [Oxalobacteraceae bacterium OM1]|nr:cadmium-translocating P-type ATPase [Oxalobacteraceae bacterium OM1]
MSAVERCNCYHCGTPVPPGSHWEVVIDQVARPMCCPGCEAVAQAIVASGMEEYYRNRDSYSPNAAPSAEVPLELQVLDDASVLRRFASVPEGAGEHCVEAVFAVEGIHCAACVWLIEGKLRAMHGIERAELNVATGRLTVRWDSLARKASEILGTLRRIGYSAYPYDPVRHAAELQKAGKQLFRRLFVAGLSMMQVMMYAVPVYMATDGTMDADMESLMRWASLFLTLPAVCYSALPFFRGAWMNLKARVLGMDVPVALGIAAAFIGSVVATLQGSGEVYFDSVTMFIFLLLCTRYLEVLARRKAAGALENLQQGLPASATRMPGYPASRETEVIVATRLEEGDVILVKPGEPVASDCVIVEGETAVDMSLLTGESIPLRKAAGDALPGGAVNAAQAGLARVTRTAQQSTLSTLVRLIERAGQAKPQLSQWADKVAGWFVAALLLLSIGVFFAWQAIDPGRAWPVAVAVLVVSCPCALSLATPSALAAATDRLVREGVLVVQPHVLETLENVTHVVLDKTGTLTSGHPALQAVHPFGASDVASCLAIAAALESASSHPIAQALVASHESGHAVQDLQQLAGLGVEGTVNGMRYRIGSARFVRELAGDIDLPDEATGITTVYLGSGQGWLARFELADGLRPDARALVDYFHGKGREVILLSGDREAAVGHVARQLGIRAAFGERLPEQKLEYVQELQAAGKVVAMVGDGINDAAVLRAADVSFAMGSGAALAQSHADAVLVSGKLASVIETHAVAVKTMRVIRQNLGWSLLYNGIAIPAAALGLLNPWLSGIGMSVSSALVVLNALRLRRRATARPVADQPAPAAHALPA